jgi:hypothetical protein
MGIEALPRANRTAKSVDNRIPYATSEADGQFACHRNLSDATIATHRQMNEATSPIGVSADSSLGCFHQ